MNDYSFKDLKTKLINLGIKKNDKIFCHSNISLFGIPNQKISNHNICKNFYKNIINVIGKNGLLIIPTYTYSFSKKRYGKLYKTNEVFNLLKTPSKMGFFSEWIRNNSDGIRTADPFYSHYIIGSDAIKYANLKSNNSFDDESIFAKIEKENFKFLNFNFMGSTFIHYLERKFNVNYRFDKKFKGHIINVDKKLFVRWIINVNYKKYKIQENHIHLFNEMKKENKLKQVKFGRGEIITFYSKDIKKITYKILEKDPKSLIC